jgi:hypothetical protein
MTVLVTLRVSGDTEQFRRFIASEPDRMREIADDARSRGAIHHRFGIGEGFVLVVDEWASADAFQQFFQTNAQIPGVMRDAGAQGEPEVTFRGRGDGRPVLRVPKHNEQRAVWPRWSARCVVLGRPVILRIAGLPAS